MVLIIGVALLFRLPPFEYVLGGQDQGVYVNMAMELAKSGGLDPSDKVIQVLADGHMRALYTQQNYSTAYLPGVYGSPQGHTFQFYHLFPVWLALFSGSGDTGLAVFALTFFSLLSLLAFYRLTYLISGNFRAAFIGTLLIAISPLHAFFSKFPVTEIPTLAFSLLSFGFLVTYLKEPMGLAGKRSLALSIAAMGLVFMTRISGFVYMPSVLVLSVAAILLVRDPHRRAGLLFWCGAIVCLYALSVVYGLKWSRPYSVDIYQISFGKLFGGQWKRGITAIVGLVVLGWMAVWIASWTRLGELVLAKATRLALGALPFVGLFIFLLGLRKAYLLGFTDTYALAEWWEKRYHLAGSGWRGFFSGSLAVAGIYLSPFILLALPASLFLARGPWLQALGVFVVSFLGHISLMQWALPYQPYYARYLVSEFAPYTIMLVVCVWSSLSPGKLRKVGSAVLVAGSAWALVLSLLQLGKAEHEGTSESISAMTHGIDSGDLVVLVSPMCCNLPPKLATTLTYTSGLNVVRADQRRPEFEEFLSYLASKYDDTYLLIGEGARSPRNATKLRSVRLRGSNFVRGMMPPTKLEIGSNRIDIYVYHPRSVMLFGSRTSAGTHLGTGWLEPERWGIWSTGQSAALHLDLSSFLRNKEDDVGQLTLRGRAFVSRQHPSQRVQFVVDGQPQREVVATLRNPKILFTLRPEQFVDKRYINIEIRTPDAASPNRVGHSSDPRVLGFGLESIKLE
jgi:hypothetical protein